jgi:hypothetical protein
MDMRGHVETSAVLPLGNELPVSFGGRVERGPKKLSEHRHRIRMSTSVVVE